MTTENTTIEGTIWGVEVWFDPAGPVARYLIDTEHEGPRITHQLIDEILGQIDVYAIEADAMQVTHIGQPLDLAARTLEEIGRNLHALVHGLGSHDAGITESDGSSS